MRRTSLAIALLFVTLRSDVFAIEVGTRPPACPALDDASIRKQLAGRVVVIDFWASWCAPCRELMPLLNALQKAHSATRLAVLAINVDERRADAERFLTRTPVAYPVVFDPAGECAAAFALQGMPSTFVIDRQGVVRYAHAGYRKTDGARLQAAIGQLLDE